MFARAVLADPAQGPDGGGPQPRDRLHHHLLRGLVQCSSSRSPWCRKDGPPEDGAAGILWIAVAFAGTLALGRTFERERQAETLRALLLAPAPRPAIYVGKLLGIIALLIGRRGRAGAAGGACCSRRRCFAHPFWLAAIAGHRHHSVSPRSARCSPPCWCARAAATCCCPCCCIRSPFRSSLPGSAARLRCCSPTSTSTSSASGWRCSSSFDVVFVTLALWTFEPLMTD